MTLADGAGEYAGPLGLLIVLLLGVAVVLLIRSMNARIRRLPDRFEEPSENGDHDPDAAS